MNTGYAKATNPSSSTSASPEPAAEHLADHIAEIIDDDRAEEEVTPLA